MNISKRPAIQGTKHSDLFLTTDPAPLKALLPFIHPDWRIWEPACGDSNTPMMDMIRDDCGRSAIGTDIRRNPAHDFLCFEQPEDWDCIITNPPYSIKDDWIARCYELGKPWALLLPYTTMEGQRRQAMFKKHGVDVLYLARRPQFTTPNGNKGGSWFPAAWFTWKILPERIMFA